MSLSSKIHLQDSDRTTHNSLSKAAGRLHHLISPNLLPSGQEVLRTGHAIWASWTVSVQEQL